MSFSHISRIVAMSDVTVKRTKAAEVEERVRSGLCLLCDREASRRGLCMTHYMAFMRRKDRQDGTDAKAAFETACIREGLVLPVGQMREIKSDDPFAKVEP